MVFKLCKSLYSASLPGTAFPLSRGIVRPAENQIIPVHADARPLVNIDLNIPRLVPIHHRNEFFTPALVEVEEIVELTDPIERVEAAYLVEPLPAQRERQTERQRMAEACRQAALNRITALQILATGRAIAPGEPTIPFQDETAHLMNAEVDDIVIARNFEWDAVPLLRNIEMRNVAPPRNIGEGAVATPQNVELDVVAPPIIIGGGNAALPRNIEENTIAPQRYLEEEAFNPPLYDEGEAVAPLRGIEGNAVVPPRVIEGEAVAPRRYYEEGAVAPQIRNFGEGALRIRRRGRPRGTTAAVMAARRAGIPAVQPYARPLRPPVRLPPVDVPPNRFPIVIEFEGPDENGWFNHDQIGAVIRNRLARAQALNDVIPQIVLERPVEVPLPADQLEENGPIMANVGCCICQTRRSNRSSQCGHLYCNVCYETYWKLKRQNWNQELGLFDKKKIPCATCRREVGSVREIHLNGI